MPEVRVDPLTGLRTIVAGERADAARAAGSSADAAGRRSTPRRTRSLEGHEDRTPPEVYAVRPDGGAPDTPGWTVRVVPNLYPALEPGRARARRRDANPDLFTAAAGARRARGDRQRARSRCTSLADLPPSRSQRAVDVVARAHARPRATPPACT